MLAETADAAELESVPGAAERGALGGMVAVLAEGVAVGGEDARRKFLAADGESVRHGADFATQKLREGGL